MWYHQKGAGVSKWNKLIRKLMTLSNDLKFEELSKILRHYGYEIASVSGSHYTFRKEGAISITLPRHKEMDVVYVKMVRDVVLRGQKHE